jgi:hypothetical protein
MSLYHLGIAEAVDIAGIYIGTGGGEFRDYLGMGPGNAGIHGHLIADGVDLLRVDGDGYDFAPFADLHIQPFAFPGRKEFGVFDTEICQSLFRGDANSCNYHRSENRSLAGLVNTANHS